MSFNLAIRRIRHFAWPLFLSSPPLLHLLPPQLPLTPRHIYSNREANYDCFREDELKPDVFIHSGRTRVLCALSKTANV